eukprot:TRINITY_DN8771_c0_g1_i1.p1 TRINITY_DN8771_c0_g1~~TRINITY_DN8771_c0_g1_i1.p1  ORF type:complete len:209 (-),score=45.86 TRINITY_DN8771_c0_g1_i1:85-711(-)
MFGARREAEPVVNEEVEVKKEAAAQLRGLFYEILTYIGDNQSRFGDEEVQGRLVNYQLSLYKPMGVKNLYQCIEKNSGNIQACESQFKELSDWAETELQSKLEKLPKMFEDFASCPDEADRLMNCTNIHGENADTKCIAETRAFWSCVGKKYRSTPSVLSCIDRNQKESACESELADLTFEMFKGADVPTDEWKELCRQLRKEGLNPQ